MDILVRTIILGLVSGSIYALASTGLVLTYRASGVLNFGYGAIAMFTTFLHWQFAVSWGWPVWLSAVVVVVVAAPMIGLFLDTQLFSRLHGQPMIISVIATVGLIVLLQGVVFFIWGGDSRTVPELFPTRSVTLPGDVKIGLADIAVFLVAGASAALLGAMFRYTRIGVAFRAVVDNRSVAGLMAINTGMISGGAWMLGTAFAALTGILLIAAEDLLLEGLFLPFFVIAQVFGAAIFGYMRSLPMAYAGGLILGVVQALIREYAPLSGNLRNLDRSIPFVIVVVAVLLAPRALRVAGLGSSFVVRTREVTTHASPRARAILAAVVFGFLAVAPAFGWADSLTPGMTLSLVFLSIVILTGYSGQISLGHTAFMGIAAFSAAHLIRDLDFPVWLAMLGGVLFTLPAGALIGIIAVRLHGLFLALMTLGFAFVANEMFFEQPGISGGFSGIPLPKPEGFTGDTSFYYLVLAAFGAAALLAANVRSGRTGRVLAAMRDSETATRALGVNIVRYKVIVFVMSAGMAGMGAILHEQIVGTASQRSVIPFLSLFYVTLTVVGGIFHVGGALASGLLFGLYDVFLSRIPVMNRLQFILFGLGATLALAQNPEGMFGEMRRGAAALSDVVRRARRPRGRPEAAPIAGGQR